MRVFSLDPAKHEADHHVGSCREMCCDDWRCPCEAHWLASRGWVVSASDLDRIEEKSRRRRERDGDTDVPALQTEVVPAFVAAYRQFHAGTFYQGSE